MKKYNFQQDDALQWLQKCTVLAEDQSAGVAQALDQHCKSLQKRWCFCPFCKLLRTQPTTYGWVVSHRGDRDFDLTERGTA